MKISLDLTHDELCVTLARLLFAMRPEKYPTHDDFVELWADLDDQTDEWLSQEFKRLTGHVGLGRGKE